MIAILLTLTTLLLPHEALLSAPMTAQVAPVGRRLPTSPSETGSSLTYTRPLGQKARYHLTLVARGQQISLGERLPVKWQAEFELCEEVIAQEPDGSMWLRLTGRTLTTKDSNGVFASGLPRTWPSMSFHVNKLGETIEVKSSSPIDSDVGIREEAFLMLAAQPPTIVLPDRKIQPEEEWRWESLGAKQTNRLLSLAGKGETLVATLESYGSIPLRLEEVSQLLGLTTRMSGNVTSHSKAELLVEQGLLKWHKGEMVLQTKSETTLETQADREVFVMEADLSVKFDLRLLEVNGSSLSTKAVNRN